MTIEDYITGKVRGGMGTTQIKMILEEEYPKEWDSIRAELAPKQMSLAKKKAKEKAEREKQEKEDKEEERKEYEESKKTWKLLQEK